MRSTSLSLGLTALGLALIATAPTPLSAQDPTGCPGQISGGGSTATLLGSRWAVKTDYQPRWKFPGMPTIYWIDFHFTEYGTYIFPNGGSIEIRCQDILI